MDSKELLLRAKETTEKQLELIKHIERAEDIIGTVKDGFICFYVVGCGSVRIDDVVDIEKLDAIKELGLVAIMNFRDDKTVELEKLLGIRKPAIINPEFEAAVQAMEQSHKKPDTVEAKLADIIQGEAKKIEDKPIIPETSLDKYPAKKDKRVKTPSNMIEADVRRMYVEESRDRKYIADHYGISESKINNYLFLHDIKRKPTKASKPAKQPDETERPSQATSVSSNKQIRP
jgi:hypothetical protein